SGKAAAVVAAVLQVTRAPAACHPGRSQGIHNHRDPSTSLRYAHHFFTISAFSSIAIPPRSANLPLSVIVLPQESASSSFIGLCSPTTRYALPFSIIPTGPPFLIHFAPQDCPCLSPTAL